MVRPEVRDARIVHFSAVRPLPRSERPFRTQRVFPRSAPSPARGFGWLKAGVRSPSFERPERSVEIVSRFFGNNQRIRSGLDLTRSPRATPSRGRSWRPEHPARRA